MRGSGQLAMCPAISVMDGVSGQVPQVQHRSTSDPLLMRTPCNCRDCNPGAGGGRAFGKALAQYVHATTWQTQAPGG